MNTKAQSRSFVAMLASFVLGLLLLFPGCASQGANDEGSGVEEIPPIFVEEADYTRDFLNPDNDEGLTMWVTSDGRSVYVVDIDKKPVIDGQGLSYDSEGDAGLAYILENGYPNKTFRNNKGMDAYITQMAIWWYLSEDKLPSDFKNATSDSDEYGLVEAAKKLVEDAREVESTGGSVSGTARIYASEDDAKTRMVCLY